MKKAAIINFTQESYLRTRLNNLYNEIKEDHFDKIKNDDERMAHFGIRQGQLFKIFREHRCLSIQEVSDFLNVPATIIFAIEDGDIVPNEHITADYVRILGASVEMESFLDFFET
jgi:ribosome-binding protein aMBF1 (putative translation factor)